MIYVLSFLIFIVFFVLAFIAGFALRVLTKQRGRDILTIYAQGMVFILLIFALSNLICAALSASIRFAGALWLSLIFFLELLFIFVDKRRFPVFFREYREKRGEMKDLSPGIKLLAALIILLIILELIFTVNFMYDQPNAIRNIYLSTLSYDTGRISMEAPIMMLCAWLALLLRVHPLTIIFTVAPFFLLPMYYSIEWSLARKLFSSGRDPVRRSLIMMLVFILLHIFGYQSFHTIEYTLLFSYFSEKVFLVHGLLPVILWFILDHFEKKQRILDRKEALLKQEEAIRALSPKTGEKEEAEKEGQEKEGQKKEGTIEAFEEEWDMKHRIINSRNLFIAFIILAVLSAGSIFILNRKINSLHEAAVGFEEELNKSMRLYEFIPEGAEDAKAFVARQKNGALIVTGGGGKEYGDQLFDYISGFNAPVEAWYLYSKNPEDTGAMKVCRERGTEIISVYYMGMMKED